MLLSISPFLLMLHYKAGLEQPSQYLFLSSACHVVATMWQPEFHISCYYHFSSKLFLPLHYSLTHRNPTLQLHIYYIHSIAQ